MNDMTPQVGSLLDQTPSQTVGPYFAYGLVPEQYDYGFASIATPVLTHDGTAGERIRLVGHVFDGAGAIVDDALIEIWQADAAGRLPDEPGADPAFRHFGRCGTGAPPGEGFAFDTVKPGARSASEAPCIMVTVMMRGLLSHAFTRIYFEDEADANTADATLATLPLQRRPTLLALKTAPGTYRFDIRMQGDGETVFFDL